MLTEKKVDVDPLKRYTEASAARVLGVHRHTMERWRKANKVKYSIAPSSGRIYYKGTELIKLWQNN